MCLVIVAYYACSGQLCSCLCVLLGEGGPPSMIILRSYISVIKLNEYKFSLPVISKSILLHQKFGITNRERFLPRKHCYMEQTCCISQQRYYLQRRIFESNQAGWQVSVQMSSRHDTASPMYWKHSDCLQRRSIFDLWCLLLMWDLSLLLNIMQNNCNIMQQEALKLWHQQGWCASCVANTSFYISSVGCLCHCVNLSV